ncbi:MAG: protein TolR [Desulfurivibrionaceae bacterium]|nr:protein TolR [Desulfurivibrionaceae bacterium]
MAIIQNRGNKRLMADINVTPLVDVMLVLLIIFMITAPMMTEGLEVNLPETTAKALHQDDKPIVITIKGNGTIGIDKISGDRTLLRQELSKLADLDKGKTILIKADKQVEYGMVVQVMTDIKKAGFDKLGMVTMPVSK